MAEMRASKVFFIGVFISDNAVDRVLLCGAPCWAQCRYRSDGSVSCVFFNGKNKRNLFCIAVSLHYLCK